MSRAPFRPRILVLASTFPRQTGDRVPGFIADLCDGLSENYRITVLAPHAHGCQTTGRIGRCSVVRFRYAWPARLEKLAYGGGIPENLRANPWRWLLVPAYLAGLIFANWRLQTRLRPLLVQAHWVIPQGLAAVVSKHTGIPLVVSAHGSDLQAGDGKIINFLRRYTMGKSNAVTVVSNSLAERARKLSPATPTHTIPIGIDCDIFHPPRVPARSNSLLYVGRLVESKGIFMLLDLAASLREELVNFEMQIVGDGPAKARFASEVRRRKLTNFVKLRGWARPGALPEIYRLSRIFLFPSEAAEGFGLSLGEAMASGCAVVASEQPVTREILENGEAGMLFTPGDRASLTQKVSTLLRYPEAADRLGQRARQKAESHYSRQAALKQFDELFRSLGGMKRN